MASKRPFLNWLRSLTREEAPEEALEEAPQPKTPEDAPAQDPFLLDLPPEHAVRKLWSLWREQSRWQPLPRFSLAWKQEEHGLPPSSATQELARLKLSVNASANKRLKSIIPPSKGEEADDAPPPDLDAQAEVFVSADAMFAWIYAYPPVGKGKELDKGMLGRALEEAKVTFGVLDELKDLPQDEERYFHLFPAAQGRPAVHGSDGRIIDLFSRKTERKVKTDEYNRVDYAAISFIQNVSEGDTICRVIPPTEGGAGRTVLGRELPTRDGIAATVPKGRNTVLSEDGNALLAAKTGHVEFNGRTFQVKPVLDIPGNVDYSTGNINFLGDVHVHGDICTGFTVRAMGSITVDGVVEASTVEAGDDLIIVKGSQGDNRAVLRSSHSIYAKYLESCYVYARENLHADCLINCDVCCDGAVEVDSGRGTIIGGYVRCAHVVAASVVGSRAEARTEITLGGLPCQEFDREVLLHEIADMEEELAAVERQPESPTKFTRMGKLRMQISLNKNKLEQFQQDLDETGEEGGDPGVRRLTCGVAYPGVWVNIGGATYQFRRETHAVTAYLDGEGNIQVV